MKPNRTIWFEVNTNCGRWNYINVFFILLSTHVTSPTKWKRSKFMACFNLYIKQTVCTCLPTLCMYLCPSFTCQPPPNFGQTSTPTWGRFLTQVLLLHLVTRGRMYCKLQNLSRSWEKKLCFSKNVQMGDSISFIFYGQRQAPIG